MKLSLDPTITAPRRITSETLALAAWYDAHPAVRRLWAVREANAGEIANLHVVVALEPTMDNCDTYIAWYLHGDNWSREIEASTRCAVNLELLEEPSATDVDIDADGEIVAAISWRDPTFLWNSAD